MRWHLIILSLLALLCAGTAAADVITISGDVSGTWSADTVLVTGEIRLPQGQTLIIEPGVEVLFQATCRFLVDTSATLLAVGTATDSIRFDGYGYFGHWNGIRFFSSSSTSRLEYCTLARAIAPGLTPDYSGAALTIMNTSPTFRHCTFRDNAGEPAGAEGGAVRLYNSSATFSNCRFYNNWATEGGAIYLEYSSPIFTRCDIHDNHSNATGGAVHAEGSPATFDQCNVWHNTGHYTGGGMHLYGSSVTLIGCEIKDNLNEIYWGGGLYFEGGTSTLTNCLISGNVGDWGGGGVYCESAELTLIGCIIKGNTASEYGGGLYVTESVGLVMDNCLVARNTATLHWGGGMYAAMSYDIRLTNCRFELNEAGQKGGGLYINNTHNTSLTRCMIVRNRSFVEGGGVCFYYSYATNVDTLTQCSIVGNRAPLGGGISFYYANALLRDCIIAQQVEGEGLYFANNQNPQVEYSDIYGNPGGDFGGTVPANLGVLTTINANGDSCDQFYNILLDPQFVDYAQEDLHLLPTSPCIDAGNPLLPFDPDGTTSDLGALYYYQSGSLAPVSGYCYLNNASNQAGTKVLFQALSGGAVTDSTFTDLAGHYQLSVAYGEYNVHYSHAGYARQTLSGQNFGAPEMLSPVRLLETSALHYVSGTLSGFLEGGIYLVEANINVAPGDSLVIAPGAQFLFDGNYSLQINGFLQAAGTEEDSLFFLANAGIPHWQGIQFNDSSSDASMLEYAAIEGSENHGIRMIASNPTIGHCRISNNAGYSGGAIAALYDAYPLIHDCLLTGNYISAISVDHGAVIERCVIVDNEGYGSGGGIYSSNDSLVIIRDCIISRNVSESDNSQGGGISIYGEYSAMTTVENCLISENEAGAGGGIKCYGNLSLSNCVIAGNQTTSSYSGCGGGLLQIWHAAQAIEISNSLIGNNLALRSGGGIAARDGLLTMTGCTLTGNTAYRHGGGLLLDHSPATLEKCTMADNQSSQAGTALSCFNSSPQISSSIFWGTSPPPVIQTAGNSAPEIIYSDVQNGWPGYGNLDLDPFFALPDSGDYHLQWGSPCVDAGDPNAQYNDPDGTRADMGGLFFDQGAPVCAQIAPRNIAYLLPPEGGALDYLLRATNVTSSPQTATIWCDLTLPGRETSSAVFGPVTVTLGGSQTQERMRTQVIPGAAPMGIYRCNVYTVVGVDTSKDDFMFGKTGVVRGATTGWNNEGEAFANTEVAGSAEDLPHEFLLYPIYPNPFNPTATVRFELPEAGVVKLDVFDVKGRAVNHVGFGESDLQTQDGVHEITFDGSELPSGIYFLRLTVGDYQAVQKLVLLK